MTITGRIENGTSIAIVVSTGSGAHLEFWAVVTELVRAPEHLEWTRCMGVADDDERLAARREVKLWVSQNVGVVQDMIQRAHENRPVLTEEQKRYRERHAYWINVWIKAFEFNHWLADKAATRVIVLLSAAGGLAMFLMPDDVTQRTALGWIALMFAVAPAVALVPLLAQWVLSRILRRFRKI